MESEVTGFIFIKFSVTRRKLFFGFLLFIYSV